MRLAYCWSILFQVLLLISFSVYRCDGQEESFENADEDNRPNIVLILADDLGYGDVQSLNSGSKISTPNFNRLSREGLTFTDAHSPSSVCTPTRYGLLTGRYCWRTTLKRGVLNGYGKPLIESDRPTIASVLKKAGYRTNIVGKWHLGLGIRETPDGFDLSQPLDSHPGTLGFDHSLIIPASLDFPPYVYFLNGKVTSSQILAQSSVPFPAYTRQGSRASDFNLRNCLDHLTDETTAVIAGMKHHSQPSFIYFPLTAPHKPVLPNPLFAGSTPLGPYGDFVRQVDHTVGRVIDALEKNGELERTILIVTSDNGSFMKKIGTDSPDHVEDQSVQGYHPERHRANAHWRGTKADIWEAGHRVPFFIRMPNAEHAATRVTSVIGLIDIMATLTNYLGIRVPKSAADSHSFASLLKSPHTIFRRPPLICHSSGGMFAVRLGPWKLVAGNGSGGREQPKGVPFQEPWVLRNLENDPAERLDFSKSQPEIYADLKQQLLEIKGSD